MPAPRPTSAASLPLPLDLEPAVRRRVRGSGTGRAGRKAADAAPEAGVAAAAPQLWAADSPAAPLSGARVTQPGQGGGMELFETAAADESGYQAWQAAREAARRAFEQLWGIPLGKRVRVLLRGERREREGLLVAVNDSDSAAAAKTLRLRLGSHTFDASQIESVARL